MRKIYISQEDSYYLILNTSNADKTNDKRAVITNESVHDEKERNDQNISGGLKKSANKSTDIIKRGY